MTATKDAGEILETIIEDGNAELSRGSAGLAFSGLAAGLNISFSTVALAIVGSLTGSIGLLAYAAYPVGFIIIILGQSELFTEHTVPPVAVGLPDRSQILEMFRVLAVIFLFKVLRAIGV